MKPSEQLLAQSKYRAIGGMRRVFSYCELSKHVRAQALSEHKGKRGGKRYTCASCGDHFGTADTIVDHIDPMIPTNRTYKDMTLDEIHSRLFCDTDNLQLLCKTCHKEKSQSENAERRKNTKKGKKRVETNKTTLNTENEQNDASKELSKEVKDKKVKRNDKVKFDRSVKFGKK